MIRQDPENHEIQALFDLADFYGRVVLEIGCGDGRLTRRYANKVNHVIAIDSFKESITNARKYLPDSLKGSVEFRHISLEDFAAASDPSAIDIAILSWSL